MCTKGKINAPLIDFPEAFSSVINFFSDCDFKELLPCLLRKCEIIKVIYTGVHENNQKQANTNTHMVRCYHKSHFPITLVGS